MYLKFLIFYIIALVAFLPYLSTDAKKSKNKDEDKKNDLAEIDNNDKALDNYEEKEENKGKRKGKGKHIVKHKGNTNIHIHIHHLPPHCGPVKPKPPRPGKTTTRRTKKPKPPSGGKTTPEGPTTTTRKTKSPKPPSGEKTTPGGPTTTTRKTKSPKPPSGGKTTPGGPTTTRTKKPKPPSGGKTTPGGPTTTTGNGKPPVKPPAKPTPKPPSDKKTTTPRSTKRTKTPPRSTTPERTECDDWMDYYYERYHSTIKINVTEYIKTDRCQEKCYNVIFGKEVYDYYRHLEILKNKKTVDFVKKLNKLSYKYLSSITIRNYIERKIISFSSYPKKTKRTKKPKTTPSGPTTTTGNGKPPVKPPAKPTPKPPSDKKTTTPRSTKRTKTPPRSTTPERTECDDWMDYYYERYHSTIKINVTEYIKTDRCQEKCYNVIFGKEVYDYYRHLEILKNKKTVDFVKKLNKLSYKYLSSITIRNYIERKIISFSSYPKFSIFEKHGQFVYYKYRRSSENQDSIWRRDGYMGKGEIFLNISEFDNTGKTTIVQVSFSRDDKYMAYAISVSGSNLWTIKFKETDKKYSKIKDELKYVFSPFMGFAYETKGFFYS
uniref:Peptidase_S9_N domain-containing protein n=1 Tax=Strongyloides papillosus TaxID=174720 RepID=A0A0N5B2U1_STREA